MKKHNILKVVLITLAIFLVLSWVLPAAYYSGQYQELGHLKMGLFEVFNYPNLLVGLSADYFGAFILFILGVGAFYGLLNKIPAYREFLDKFVETTKGTENMVLIIIMLLIAVGVSFTGFQLPLLLVFPMLVSIILLMGFDKLTAALTLVGSSMIGLIGSTYGIVGRDFYFEQQGQSYNILTSNFEGLTPRTAILVKVIILVIGLAILILNVLLHVRKTRSITKVIKKEERVAKKVEAPVAPAKVSKAAKDTKKAPAKKTNAKKASTKKTGAKKKNNNKAFAKQSDVIVVKESVEKEEVNAYVPESDGHKHTVWPMTVAFILLAFLMVFAYVPWASLSIPRWLAIVVGLVVVALLSLLFENKKKSAIIAVAAYVILVFVLFLLAKTSLLKYLRGIIPSTLFTDVTNKVTSYNVSVWAALILGLANVTLLSLLSKNKMKTLALADGCFIVLVLISFLTSGVKLKEYFGAKITLFGQLLGTTHAFGTWTAIDMLLPLLLVGIILAIVYKVKFDDCLDGVASGVKKALPLVIIGILIYTATVITNNHPFQAYIYQKLGGVIEKFTKGNVLLVALSTMLSGIFNASSFYAFNNIIPLVTKGSIAVSTVVLPSMYGFAMLFAPTSLILMTGLSYLDIPYGKWFKSIWKLLLELLVLLVIVFLIIA